MFYIFNKFNECIAACYNTPCIEDLKTRGESYIEDSRTFEYLNLLKNNNGVIEICAPKKEEPTYEEVLEETKNKINEYRLSAENDNVLYKDKSYQADTASVNRLTIALNLDNEQIEWKTYDNSVKTLTKEDIKNILKLVAERNSKIFKCVSDAKDRVNAINNKKKESSITEEEAKEMLKNIVDILYI